MTNPEIRIPGVVLAAGYGRRMGIPKALVELDGEPLVVRAVRTLRSAGCNPVIAIVNEEVLLRISSRPEGKLLEMLENPRPDAGMLSSVHIAIGAIEEYAEGCCLLPVDHPYVMSSTVASLLHKAASNLILIPTHDSRRGHPPLIGSKFFPDVLGLPSEEGLRGLYSRVPEGTIRELAVEDPGILKNVNTPEQLSEE